jgi:hypothetical protein
VQVETHSSFRNLTSISENITSELAETHTLAVKQHCCFNAQSAAAAKLVGWEVKDSVAIAAVLLLLPEKPRYPKYGAFTLLSKISWQDFNQL